MAVAHTGQRANDFAARDRQVGSLRSRAGVLLVEGNDGVEERIDQRDAGKLRLHRLDGADASLADRRRQLRSGKEGGVGVDHDCVPSCGGQ
ncbi:hypothetical protein [Mesorhizobium sp. WSM4904]|uniref:hypothetical protein n=1 Tax=Mesorhizobium sp. WSM4904 TaxID=3038545 RepID=UPI00325B593E